MQVFKSLSTQLRSFWRRSSQPIYWSGSQETKPNTTKASNTGIKWYSLPHKKR